MLAMDITYRAARIVRAYDGCAAWRPKERFPEILANISSAFIVSFMSTAREIEEAIRSLPASERNKLVHHIPDLFPELSGDAEWERIIADERPRPALTQMLDEIEDEFRRGPEKFSELSGKGRLRKTLGASQVDWLNRLG